MKRFRCRIERSQFQTVEFEAEDYETAFELAHEMFDDTKEYREYIDVYSVEKIKRKKRKSK